MSYSYYDNMSMSEKDKLADGHDLETRINEFERINQQQNAPDDIMSTPKRRHEDLDNDIPEVENDAYQTVESKGRKKIRQLLNPDKRNLGNENSHTTHKGQQGQEQVKGRNNMGRGRVIFNSQSHKNDINISTNFNQQNSDERFVQHHVKDNITSQVLHYAVTQQFPPIKINCSPEVKDHAEGINLTKALFSHIQEDFRKLNKSYNRPIGFDTWFVDKKGALMCFTREIELFVYLWDVSHYPTKLLQTDITPYPPIHLPPQNSIILKFVPASISFDEILEAVTDVVQSKFLLEEMKGSLSAKSRHIRLDLASKDEMKKLLNSGVIPLNGQLIEITEFLAPPQILICQRCNRPGHVKRVCTAPFDRCRRCGLNKSQGEHQQCTIKCHHCDGAHLATDYRCPIIAKFRGDLIDELKRRPELLPKDTQLFIPVEFRKGGKNMFDSIRTNQAPVSTPLPTSNYKNWSILNQTPYTTQGDVPIMQNDLLQEIKVLRNDYEKLKLEFDRREAELINKHENYKSKLGTMLNLLVLQNNQQNECIAKMYTVVNEIVPVIADSLKAIHTLTEKVVVTTGDLNLKHEYNSFRHIIEQRLSMLNDRNDLSIEYQRATADLLEKTSVVFQQGMDLLKLNEH